MALPRGYISHSQIRAYNECPRKYWFGYVENIQVPINDKIYLGEVFHRAIEYYYLQRLAGVIPAAGAVEEHFQTVFDAEAQARDISWNEPRRETRQRGLAFVRHFLLHVAPASRPLMVEKELNVELPGSGVVLKGVLDLVEEDYGITDFKTTTSRWSDSRARHSPQMVIYKYLFDRSFGPLRSRLKYEIFYGKSSAGVRHQTLAVVPEEGAEECLLAMIDHVIARICAGAFPANESPLCNYCDFRGPCRQRGPA